MSEHEIMWIGRRSPGAPEGPQETEAPEYGEAVVAACAAVGCEASRYVAARGPFGSWLVELKLGGRPARLIWNGKSGELSLETQRPPSAWDSLAATSIDDPALDSLLAAARRLLLENASG
jgi:hypothetical protein